MPSVARARGEGLGVITQDGCAVDVYVKLPYRGELELLSEHLPPRCSVLELGCGTGRLTRPLLERGHAVTSVDNSIEMLRHVPAGAHKICCDIERLDLGRTFDVVLLASNLINISDDQAREAQLAACRRHLVPHGEFIFQRFDPVWLRAVAPGPFPSIGEVAIEIARALHDGSLVEMSIRYAIGDAEWRHHFIARLLDDGDIRLALHNAGFSTVKWIDSRWGVARHS